MEAAKDNASPGKASQTKGAMMLAAAGLVAAFGAASCCALPLVLGSLGLGGGWLVAAAWLAQSHRDALLAVAVVCLAGGGGLLLWGHRRGAACAPTGTTDAGRACSVLSAGMLSVGAVLVALGFAYG